MDSVDTIVTVDAMEVCVNELDVYGMAHFELPFSNFPFRTSLFALRSSFVAHSPYRSRGVTPFPLCLFG